MGLQAHTHTHTHKNCSEATKNVFRSKSPRKPEDSEQAVLKSGGIKAQEDQAKLAIQ